MERTDMKRKKSAGLSETQMEIMREVWAGGEVTVTQVCEALNRKRPLARNTVHTLMDRLARRGWLKRRLEGQSHYYSARSPQAATLRDLVSRMIDTAFGGSVEDLVVALLRGRRLTAEEAGRIRKLIEKAKKEDL
jgi:BlaI family transcriptional regulator, penicillinase repressor